MSRNHDSIPDETLLGYLLNALSVEEQSQIQKQSADDPILNQRIEDLRSLLEPLGTNPEQFEPRANLSSDTMAYIQTSVDSSATTKDNQSIVSMSQPLFESSRATKLAWLDSLVALAVGVVILSFLLPSILLSRESARRLSCATNIRVIGQAITDFAYANREHRLPQIETTGPLDFAGVTTIRLKDAGLLPSSNWIWCPSAESIDVDQLIPNVSTYLTASPAAQNNWRYTAGGTYSYNLGNVVSGMYTTPSMDLDSHFAVMGDSLWTIELDEDRGPIHGRNASNILFSDGRIQFVRVDRINAEGVDNPYLNRANQQAVGYGRDDSCLGPSYQFPLIPRKFE